MPDRTDLGRATARAGVAGNPSDALGGAAVAVPIEQLSARVELVDARSMAVERAEAPDPFPSVSALVEHTERYGHDGGDRLVTAAIVTLRHHLRDADIEVDDEPFRVRWSTDIPRSVGLAGSSALVIATLRALLSRWDLDLAAPRVAALALAAESDELGIAAGWMDRSVQAHGRPTLVDTRSLDRNGVPSMRLIEPGAPVELVVAWDPAGAAPSGRLHGDLRAALAAGDPLVTGAVDELVVAAHDAADALADGDVAGLSDAVGRSCALRDRLGALDAATAAMAAAVREVGGAATSAGSGGAVLAVPGPAGTAALVEQMAARGWSSSTVRLGASPTGQSRSDTSSTTSPRTSLLDGPTRTS
jgi:glucuronokinase